MIGLACACPTPGMRDVDAPAVDGLVLAALGALSGAGASAHLASDDPGLEALAARAGARFLRIDPPGQTPPHAPPGALQALATLNADAQTPVLCVDCLNPALDADLLLQALAAWKKGGGAPLFGAAPGSTHPCRAVSPCNITASRVLGAPAPEPPDVPGLPEPCAALLGDNAGTALLLDCGGPLLAWKDAPQAASLALLAPPRGERREACRTRAAGAWTFFACDGEIPQADGPVAALLLAPTGAGAADMALPYAPAAAPWTTDPGSGRRVLRAGATVLHGRQSFPEALAFDGSLCVGAREALAAALAAPDWERVRPFALPAAGLRTETDLLRLLLAREAGEGTTP